MASFVALVALSAWAQNGRQKQAEKDSPTKDLPFDPHDISGIWKNPGGFDVALGSDRPPMTEWGKEKWSKTIKQNRSLRSGVMQSDPTI